MQTELLENNHTLITFTSEEFGTPIEIAISILYPLVERNFSKRVYEAEIDLTKILEDE